VPSLNASPQRAPLTVRWKRGYHPNLSPPPRPYNYEQTPGGGFAQFRVPFLAAPLFGFQWERSAKNYLLDLIRCDLVPGNMCRVGIVPVEKRLSYAGHPVPVYTLCPYGGRFGYRVGNPKRLAAFRGIGN